MTRNVIELPPEIYDAVRQQAAAEHKSPDTLVVEWVSAHLDSVRADRDEELEAFQREVAAFQRLKPRLLEQYAGEYVAVRKGEVVANGKEKLDVSRQVRERYGPGGYYVALVTPGPLRTVRMPSPRVTRE
ncbi:MAG: DUF5678 domain-containing protein [Anaerolineae bacterium]|nr:DUF5678 domain-containing protein [Anaerolineae bacterium]